MHSTLFHLSSEPKLSMGLVFLAGIAALLFLAVGADALTFTVNSIAEPGDGVCDAMECTLREALSAANANPGMDLIGFDIPGAGPHTIQPMSALPPITSPVILDGKTEPDFVGAPVIELDGSNAGATAGGLTIAAPDTTVRGLVINRFGGAGITIRTSEATGNLVEDNFIGTDVAGITPLGNYRGVYIHTGASNNTIAGNVVSGNQQFGIGIYEGANSNSVEGNFIGTDRLGEEDVGNTGFGVRLHNVSDNTIGGQTPEARNTISGNDGGGIVIVYGATDNLIQGNFIGTDVTGSVAIGNTDGISINHGSQENVIGGLETGARNLISGNSVHGVWMGGDDTTDNLVQGNFIGTDVNGTVALGNLYGVRLQGVSDNTIGNANVISGNRGSGVRIDDGSEGNSVSGNLIGTDANGTAALGNAGNGVGFIGSATSGNTIGGTTPDACNIISGNLGDGVSFDGGTTENLIQGNFIGTDIHGMATLGNTGHGVRLIHAASNNIVGGTEPGTSNLISGNGADGVHIMDEATANLVAANLIGTDATGFGALGNAHNGVYIESSDSNTIGGLDSGAGNAIAHNGGAGVVVHSGIGNAVLSNAIFANLGLGIDVGLDGVTLNDIGDGDDRQNFPVLGSAQSGCGTSVQGTLNSTSNTSFRLEFFASQAGDGSGFGEGQRFIGSEMVTTDGSGNADFVVNLPTSIPQGQLVTATATDLALNNTSEFSEFIEVVSEGEWQYVRAIPITGSTEMLTGYQVLVTLTPASFDYGHAKPDGSDIRFLSAGECLSYWIENWDLFGESRVWVKVPVIPPEGTTIDMYYGNFEAMSASNIKTTFIVGDDFNDNSVDMDLWEFSQNAPFSIREQNQRLEIDNNSINSGGWVGANANVDLGRFVTDPLTDFAIEVMYYGTGQTGPRKSWASVSLGQSIGQYIMQIRREPDYFGYQVFIHGPDYEVMSRVNHGDELNQWHMAQVFNDGIDTRFVVDGMQVASDSRIPEFTGVALSLNSYQNSSERFQSYWDNFRVRKYVNPEPVAIVDPETPIPPPVAVFARAHVNRAIYEATSPDGVEVMLDGSRSSGADGMHYQWDFDYDGSNFDIDATGDTVMGTFGVREQPYTVALRVTSSGSSSIDTVSITVQDTRAPEVTLLSPHGGEIIRENEPFLVEWEPATDTVASQVDVELYYSVADPGDTETWVQIGTPGIPNTGSYEWTPQGIGDSPHVWLIIQATDAAQNRRHDVSPASFIIDNTASSIPIITSPPSGAILGDGNVPIAGFVEIGEDTSIYTVSIYDGAICSENHLASSLTESGAFAVMLELTDGFHHLQATATDSAGNVSPLLNPPQFVSFEVDTVAPDIPTNLATVPAGDISNENQLTITGTSEAESTVTLMDGGRALGSILTDGSGVFSYGTRPLADGVHVFAATATDDAGNVSGESVTLTVTVDTVAPDVAVLVVDSTRTPRQEFTSNEMLWFYYETEEGTATEVVSTVPEHEVGYDEALDLYYIEAPLPVGAVTITVTVTDEAGNSSSDRASATVSHLAAQLDVDPNVFLIEIPQKTKKSKNSQGKSQDPIPLTCYLSIVGVEIAEIDEASLLFNDRLEPVATLIRESVLEAKFEMDVDFVASFLSLPIAQVDKIELKPEGIKVSVNTPNISTDEIALGQLQVTGNLVSGASFSSEDASRQVMLKELAAPVVSQTFLAQNYPNPFNPETWIPYGIVSDSDVTICIFNVQGRLVRRLDIGRKEAGFYVAHGDAAHWDGRNRTGERVASGVYYYTLQAGDVSTTRRMVILK